MLTSIVYNDIYHTFVGYIGNEKVCTLDLYEEEYIDSGQDPIYWLNGIYTEDKYQKNGYARDLVKEALKCYGKFYISTATDYEHKQRGDNTSRELTTEGAKFVNKLKSEGILNSDWFINPF